MHREQSREFGGFRPAHGQPGSVEAEREATARAGGIGQHRHDVGEHLVGDGLPKLCVREQLHRFDGPFAEAIGGIGEPRPHVDRVADPRIGGPGSGDADDGVVHVHVQPHRSTTRAAGGRIACHVGCRRRIIRGQNRIEVRAVLPVKHQVGLQALDPHPPEVAQREQNAGQTIAHFDAADGHRRRFPIPWHDLHVVEDDRPQPAHAHAGKFHVASKLRHRRGNQLRHPLRGRQERRQAEDAADHRNQHARQQPSDERPKHSLRRRLQGSDRWTLIDHERSFS